MYSVVLMMAMTGAGDTPAGLFDHHSCCGCSCSCWGGDCCGGYSCCGGCHGCCGGHGHHGHHGCCGGGHSFFGGHGCCGGGHGHHHGHHGCCGCCGGYSCCGCSGYYGCCGGWSCCGGYGCCGGYACGGGYACDGGVAAPAAEAAPKKEEKKGDKGTMAPAPATIIVSLPADAQLSIDDAPTSSTSERRVFVSPELNPGKQYHYTLKAEWNQGGKTVVVTKEVAVTAGNETTVSLEAANVAGVASR